MGFFCNFIIICLQIQSMAETSTYQVTFSLNTMLIMLLLIILFNPCVLLFCKLYKLLNYRTTLFHTISTKYPLKHFSIDVKKYGMTSLKKEEKKIKFQCIKVTEILVILIFKFPSIPCT